MFSWSQVWKVEESLLGATDNSKWSSAQSSSLNPSPLFPILSSASMHAVAAHVKLIALPSP